MKRSRLQYWIALISSFLAGQGAVQLLNLIGGFFLLRWLSVEAYAQYSLAFGFQSALSVLVDLGFCGSIITLVGERGANKEVVGTYIRSAKYFRNRLYALVIPIAAIAFMLVTAKQQWDWQIQALLFISIVSSLFFQGWISYYSAPILIHQQLRQFYQPQILASAGRIVFCFMLYAIAALSSWTTAWVNSIATGVSGFFYRQDAKSLAIEPKNSDPKIDREMIDYVSPIIPSIIFSAFQGQISVFLITIFGQTQNIAEVAALGRLSQLFFILIAFNRVIIEPYIAKVSRQQLIKRYLQIIGGVSVISICLCLVAFLFPQPFLWVLGSNYKDLQVEVGWTIVSSCFNYIASVMWTINNTRKWTYWWHTILYITLPIIVQVGSIFIMDLSKTIDVIYLSVVTAITIVFVHILNGVYGAIKGSRLEAR